VAKGNELLSPARPLGSASGATATSSADSGREFWEAWADEKVSRTSSDNAIPVVPVISDAPTEIEVEVDRPAGSPPDPVDEVSETSETSEVVEDSEGGDLTVRLYVNIGKPEDIRELLCGGLGEDAARVGSIALRNTHAYVRVPEDLVDRVIEAARGKSYKERELVVERARR
jgi:hypothetical protein